MPKKKLQASAKPTQPPTGADMNALVVRIDDLSKKVLGKGFTSKLPLWKRWVGGEKEYDVTGLRDVVKANADFTDAIKRDVDAHGQAIIEMRAEIAALKEAPPSRPFP